MHYFSKRINLLSVFSLFVSSAAYGQSIDLSDHAGATAIIEEATANYDEKEKKAFTDAYVLLLLSLHPQTKDLEHWPAMLKLGELGADFIPTADGAFDGLTVQMIVENMDN